MNQQKFEVSNLDKFLTVGEWYETMKLGGFSVPLQLCIGLSKSIKRHNLTFDEAYKFLEDNEKIILIGKCYIYDMTGDEL